MICYEKLGTDKEPVRLLEDKLMEIREPCSLLQYECVRRAYFVRDQVLEEYRVQRIVQSLKEFLLRRGTGTCHGTITSWPSHSICKALKGPKSLGLHMFPQLTKYSSPDIIGIQVLYSAIYITTACTQCRFSLSASLLVLPERIFGPSLLPCTLDCHSWHLCRVWCRPE